jgi:hypothetical protein
MTISLRVLAAICATIVWIESGHADCSSLRALAQQHANDMARRNSLDHAGFMERRGPAGAVAENVAMGCETEACARRMWMQSPRHRANMMLGGARPSHLRYLPVAAGIGRWKSAATVVVLLAMPMFAMSVSLLPELPAEAAVTMVLLVGTSLSMEATHREHHADVSV